MARIAFIYPDFESLGTEYLMAACQQHGHDIAFFYYQIEDISIGSRKDTFSFTNLVRDIRNFSPHIAAFSCVTDNYLYQVQCAKDLKSIMLEVKTIFGGIHVTAVPHEVIKIREIDCIAIGEAEESLIHFLDKCRFEKKCMLPDEPVKGIVFKDSNNNITGEFQEGDLPGLDGLPFPDKEKYYTCVKHASRNYTLITSRGCPYKCSYCFNSYYHDLRGKSIIRQRSVGNVIDELITAKKKYSPKHILFLDDSFTIHYQWLFEFCNEYKDKIDLPFACITIPQYMNMEKAKMLKMAGCVNMQIGIQSLEEQEICSKILQRKSDNSKIAEVISALKQVGIMVQVDHMLGIPGDTIENQEKSLHFYNRYRPDIISIFWLTYYPKTHIIEIAKGKGILSEKDIKSIESGERLKNKTSYFGGSMDNPEPFLCFAFILSYLPLLPRALVKYLISSRLYRKFKVKSFFISILLPRAIQGIVKRKAFRERANIYRFINKSLLNTCNIFARFSSR